MRTIKPRKLHIYNVYNETNNLKQQKNNITISKSLLIILIIIVTVISSSLGSLFMINIIDSNNTTNTGGIIKSNISLNETNSISSSVEKVYDAVVVVEVYDKDSNLISTGTGFVYKLINNKAYLMTNNHVISKGENIKVLFTNDKELDAEIIGSDIYSDIAVLSIDASDEIKIAPLGESSKLKAGDTVFTVGSPEGSNYAGTVTKGILSAKNRLVAVALENNYTTDYYMEVLQTDAAINPGNSGGPLCNVSGEVIGITNMKLVDDTVEGMGFAIPVEEALRVAEVLEKDGKITRPKLGISVSPIGNKIELYYQTGILVPNDINEGIVIISVEAGSSAETSGLKKGDIITELAGTKTTSLAEFRYELYKHNLGEELEITYTRDGNQNKTKIVLSE